MEITKNIIVPKRQPQAKYEFNKLVNGTQAQFPKDRENTVRMAVINWNKKGKGAKLRCFVQDNVVCVQIADTTAQISTETPKKVKDKPKGNHAANRKNGGKKEDVIVHPTNMEKLRPGYSVSDEVGKFPDSKTIKDSSKIVKEVFKDQPSPVITKISLSDLDKIEVTDADRKNFNPKNKH